jgi:hypothetical protein
MEFVDDLARKAEMPGRNMRPPPGIIPTDRRLAAQMGAGLRDSAAPPHQAGGAAPIRVSGDRTMGRFAEADFGIEK